MTDCLKCSFFKRPTNLIEFQNILINLMRGENSGDEYWFVKSSYFEFECDENIKWTLDGEYGGNPKHTVINVMPSAMTFIIDKTHNMLKE